jgi:hypothetical protein
VGSVAVEAGARDDQQPAGVEKGAERMTRCEAANSSAMAEEDETAAAAQEDRISALPEG